MKSEHPEKENSTTVHELPELEGNFEGNEVINGDIQSNEESGPTKSIWTIIMRF